MAQFIKQQIVGLTKDNGTIFPTKLHQNVLHFLRNEETFLEWKIIPGSFDKIEVIGNLSSKTLKRLEIEDLRVRLKI